MYFRWVLVRHKCCCLNDRLNTTVSLHTRTHTAWYVHRPCTLLNLPFVAQCYCSFFIGCVLIFFFFSIFIFTNYETTSHTHTRTDGYTHTLFMEKLKCPFFTPSLCVCMCVRVRAKTAIKQSSKCERNKSFCGTFDGKQTMNVIKIQCAKFDAIFDRPVRRSFCVRLPHKMEMDVYLDEKRKIQFASALTGKCIALSVRTSNKYYIIFVWTVDTGVYV